MKILKRLILVTLISTIAFACNKDDDGGGNTTAENQVKIIGTWKYTSSTTNGVVDMNNYICNFEETYEYNASSVINKYYGDPSGDDGSNCQLEGTYTVNYSIDGNSLSSTDDGFTYTQAILVLNSTTLILQDVDGDDIYTETYTKQ